MHDQPYLTLGELVSPGRKIAYVFPDNLDMYDRCRWLNCLSALLQNIQQDPTPAISLIRKFIDVPGFSFEIGT